MASTVISRSSGARGMRSSPARNSTTGAAWASACMDLPAHDRIENARPAQRRQAAGGRGPHGVQQLYSGKLALHSTLLWARTGPLRQGEPRTGSPRRAGGLDSRLDILPALDAALLFRAAGVVVALAHLPGARTLPPPRHLRHTAARRAVTIRAWSAGRARVGDPPHIFYRRSNRAVRCRQPAHNAPTYLEVRLTGAALPVESRPL